MIIKNAVTTEGVPVKIRPFSLEMLDTYRNSEALLDITGNRIEKYYLTKEYVESHEKYAKLFNEAESKAPELKQIFGDIDDIVTSKEIDCFREGYQAGIADLITAMTFNELQITHTGIIDFEAINKQKKEAKKNELTDRLTEIAVKDPEKAHAIIDLVQRLDKLSRSKTEMTVALVNGFEKAEERKAAE